ncbi:MAG: hypothetical protein HGA85_03080 [Nanoarchaeota archaeon]|nr:hypothetical protein [Nanoarchaeota archaeon]
MPNTAKLPIPVPKDILAKGSYSVFFVGSILLWNFLGDYGLFSEWYHQVWQWLLILVSGYFLFRK